MRSMFIFEAVVWLQILKEDTSKLAKETKIKKELIQQLKRHDPAFLDDTITVQVKCVICE